jgi:hypothetical protein
VTRENEYSNQTETLLEMLHLTREFNFLHSKEQLNTSTLHYSRNEYTDRARSDANFYFANFDVEIDLGYVSYALALKILTSLCSGIWIYVCTSLSKKSYYFIFCLFPVMDVEYNTSDVKKFLVVTNKYGSHSY